MLNARDRGGVGLSDGVSLYSLLWCRAGVLVVAVSSLRILQF